MLTTRPLRDGEVNGREYYFISQDEMDALDYEHKLIERRDFETVEGVWRYATGFEEINLEKYSYLTPNTWIGYQKYLEYFDSNCLVPVYFELDKGVRLERALIRERKQTKANYLEMCRRFLADAKDFAPEFVDFYKPYLYC